VNDQVARAGAKAQTVLSEVETVVVGRSAVLRLVMTALLADLHVLLEDMPGQGKTLIATTLAASLGCESVRIQHTPDMLPSDITGATVYDRRTGDPVFRPGPIFHHVVLADEINRTPPKTQAALLEAMSEGQVSVDGTTHPLPQPFFVIATQNPIEYEGTYPLPEAQLDRFGMRIRLGYVDRGHEIEMVRRRLLGTGTTKLTARASAAQVLTMRKAVAQVHVDDGIVEFCVRLAEATRAHPQLEVGASPRATLALVAACRAWALLGGRDFVVPDDVVDLAAPVLAHRLVLRADLWGGRVTGESILAEVLPQLPTPPLRPRPS
jgi:MoxR-like ATPase